MEHLLAYMDQASFLGLRATGRQLMLQIVWIMDGSVEEAALRRFDAALGHTMLGRRVERSSVPGGRHHWVRNHDPGDIHVDARPMDPDSLVEWVASLVFRPVDPEHGAGRSLAARPLTDGTTAIVLSVPHTLADLGTVIGAVCDAALGRRIALDLSEPRISVTWRDRVHDARTVIRSLPDAGKGLVQGVRLARASGSRDRKSRKTRRELAAPQPGGDGDARGAAIAVPAVFVVVDENEWEARAAALGGLGNTLRLGLATRAAAVLDSVDAEGRVIFSIPVSDRKAHDSRANALVPVTLHVDPSNVTHDLRGLRAAFSDAIARARDESSESAMNVLALVPFIPQSLARRFEANLWDTGPAVYFSHLGRMDPAVLRPLGADALLMTPGAHQPVRLPSRGEGASLAVVTWLVAGKACAVVGAEQVGRVESSQQLQAVVRQILDDFGIGGEVRPL